MVRRVESDGSCEELDRFVVVLGSKGLVALVLQRIDLKTIARVVITLFIYAMILRTSVILWWSMGDFRLRGYDVL